MEVIGVVGGFWKPSAPVFVTHLLVLTDKSRDTVANPRPPLYSKNHLRTLYAIWQWADPTGEDPAIQ